MTPSGRRTGGLRCPACGQPALIVIDSRSNAAQSMIRRRRKCLACDARSTTYEATATDLVKITKALDTPHI